MQNKTSSGAHVERSQPRLAIDLEAIIQAKDTDGNNWKEMATVTTISRNGAGFSSPQPCSVGRLVGMVLQMPRDLRVYDRKKDLYPVLGLVQYCNPSRVPGEDVYDIGVAFVGKNPPESHERNPSQQYRITGMEKNGLWSITEADGTFKPRRYPRYSMSLQFMVSLLQRETRSVVKNTATTRDVSIGGASLKCDLDAKVGDKVKVACEKLDFYSIATVRNCESTETDENLLRVEFLENEFPVDKLHLAKEPKAEPVENDDDEEVKADHSSVAGEMQETEPEGEASSEPEIVQF